MKYNNNDHITTLDDVVAFVSHLTDDCKISFHPDDDFDGYIDDSTPETISLYNRLNDECFMVCEHLNVDLYQIHLEAQMKHLNIFG